MRPPDKCTLDGPASPGGGTKLESPIPLNFCLRPAIPEDIRFVSGLHSKSVKGRATDAEQRMLRQQFVPGQDQIIEIGGEPIGCFGVDDRAEVLYLRYIALLPEVQGRGMGTALLGRLLYKAKITGIPVELTVDKTNPARRLYERLGFRLVLETDTRARMRYTGMSR